MDKNVTDQEQRYLKYMGKGLKKVCYILAVFKSNNSFNVIFHLFWYFSANLDELRRQDLEEREYYKQQIEELKDRCEDKREWVEDERLKFMEFKKQVGLGAVNSRSGKPIPQRVSDCFVWLQVPYCQSRYTYN